MMMSNKTVVKVRCVDCTVFRVDPVTWDPLGCGVYDPWCYSDPEPGAHYIEHYEWLRRRMGYKKLAYET